MEIDARELRNALGRFATGVCVISTLNARDQAVGLTANSFSSVSLDPALVLWCLGNASDVYQTFSAPSKFAINVLSSEQEVHSALYAKKGDHVLDPRHFSPGENGAPVIRGALASFECDLYTTYEGGDHVIILGQIRNLISQPTGDPLLFYAGAYRALR